MTTLMHNTLRDFLYEELLPQHLIDAVFHANEDLCIHLRCDDVGPACVVGCAATRRVQPSTSSAGHKSGVRVASTRILNRFRPCDGSEKLLMVIQNSDMIRRLEAQTDF